MFRRKPSVPNANVVIEGTGLTVEQVANILDVSATRGVSSITYDGLAGEAAANRRKQRGQQLRDDREGWLAMEAKDETERNPGILGWFRRR